MIDQSWIVYFNDLFRSNWCLNQNKNITSKCWAFSSSDIWFVEAHFHSWTFILSVTFLKIVNPWVYLLSPLAHEVFLTPYHILAFLKKSIFSYIGDFPNFNQFFVIHMTLIVQEIVQIRSAIFYLSCS